MLGKDLLIAIGGRVIAAQSTCNLNLQQDTIEVCSPVSGPWREYIPSTLGWDVSCDGLIYAPEYADELMEVLTSRQKVRLSYYDPELRIVRSGYAIPTGLQQGASISDLANYSLTFLGSGELGKVKEKYVPLTNDINYHYSQFRLDKNHNLYGGSAAAFMRGYSFELTQPSRVKIQCSAGTRLAVVAPFTTDVAIAINNRDNLRFFQHELMHISGSIDGIEKEDTKILPPGNYMVLMNDLSDKPDFHLFVLSLPTE